MIGFEIIRQVLVKLFFRNESDGIYRIYGICDAGRGRELNGENIPLEPAIIGIIGDFDRTSLGILNPKSILK